MERDPSPGAPILRGIDAEDKRVYYPEGNFSAEENFRTPPTVEAESPHSAFNPSA
jgi:hypothetical protein